MGLFRWLFGKKDASALSRPLHAARPGQDNPWAKAKRLVDAGDSKGLLRLRSSLDLTWGSDQVTLQRILDYIATRENTDRLLVPFLQKTARDLDGPCRPLGQKAQAILDQLHNRQAGTTGREAAIQDKIRFFTSTDMLWPLADLQTAPHLVPDEKGCYGWYFDVIPPGIPGRNFICRAGWYLLYVGIAGKREDSSRTLRGRILHLHLGQASEMSTLRYSLGYLLRKDLPVEPDIRRSHKLALFGDDGEQYLTQWMISHARVTWVVDPAPADVEAALLQQHGRVLPLNIQDNPANAFGPVLSRQRTAYRKQLLGG